STAASHLVKRLFSEVFKISFSTSTTCASFDLVSHVSGRRILQRYSLLSTPFFHRFRFEPQAGKPKHFQLYLETVNSLIYKEFSVPTAPEVGRIIETSEGASTFNLTFL
ncbi:hypothetical protein, partial [Pseudomonas sp. NPDC088444]|uniref:hypothetical protein n=1 Tax=Pseudomonas sp. NPDC088444 TaxID=3364456 RepID=UPI00384B0492